MVNVSKQELDEEVLQRIHSQFTNSVLRLESGKRGTAYLNELLTKSEKIMLAKRLAIIAMLIQGESYYRIAQALKVSDVTAAKLDVRLDHGEFDTIRTFCASQKRNSVFWAEIEILLRGGMPSMGKDRWKTNKELRERAKRSV